MNNRVFASCFALAAFATVAAPTAAQSPSASSSGSDTPTDAQGVIDRMLERNSGLNSYTVRVHVRLHTNIPLYSPNLDGTAYYKRPGNFAVVFDRVPGYARSFQKLFDDVGDPTGWQKDSNIKLQGTQQLDGHPMLVLEMTKKIYSDQIKDTVAFVDPNTYELTEMDWHYTNGQSIVMKQSYKVENGFSVVAQQEVNGNRRIHFSGEAQYEPYHTNVGVDDAVFKQ